MALDVGDLFERYHGVVYRRCLALLRNEDEAAEAVQDIFERAIRGLGRFRLRSSPLTWLYAIATRHCLQQLRGRSLRDVKAVLIGTDPNQTDGVAHLAARAELDRIVGSLDAQELEMALYAFRDGMTQEEIADVLRLSRKTVGKRLRVLTARLSALVNLESRPALATAPTGRSATA